MSNPKAKDIRARGGDDSPIMLIPELCTRTGKVGRGGVLGVVVGFTCVGL